MPPTEPVHLAVAASNASLALKTGATLTFMQDNWMKVQTVALSGCGRTLSLQFSDNHLGNAEISDLDAVDARLGRVIGFDSPMLPTEP